MAVIPRFTAWAELDRRIWTLAWARAVNTVGLSLVMAFLGVYVVDERGYSAALFGAIALGANLTQSMTNAWAGELSDRIGRRPIMVGSLVLRALAIALLGVQILLDAPLWSLGLNFVASAALRGCFEPAAYALVADIARPEQRVAAFGLQRMGINLGWAVGPAAGGLLAVVIPYGAVFFFASAGLLAAAWTCHGLVDPREKGAGQHLARARLRDAFAEAMRQPPMVALLLGSFLFALAHTQLFSVFAIYMTKGLGLEKDEVRALARGMRALAPAVAREPDLVEQLAQRLARPVGALARIELRHVLLVDGPDDIEVAQAIARASVGPKEPPQR